MGVIAFTRQAFPSGTMFPDLSSRSNSSEMSPTICSRTSSIVMRPETLPNSSITSAMCERVALKSRRSTFVGWLSGMKRAGRRSVFTSRSGFVMSFRRSFAWINPNTLSRSPSTAGKREWPDSFTIESHVS